MMMTRIGVDLYEGAESFDERMLTILGRGWRYIGFLDR